MAKPYKPYVPGYVPTSTRQQKQRERQERIRALISPRVPTGKLPWETKGETTVPDGTQDQQTTPPVR